MNGFLSMVEQAHIEEALKELDSIDSTSVSKDRSAKILDLMKEIMAILADAGEEMTPLEIGMMSVLQVVNNAYVLGTITAPNVILMVISGLVAESIEVNNTLKPTIHNLRNRNNNDPIS